MSISPGDNTACTASRICLAAAIAVAVAAFGYFLVRGPVRATGAMGDYMEIYAAARAWGHGENPYALATVQRVWLHSGIPADYTAEMVDLPSLYPPGALPAFAPFSMVSWPAARWIWLGANVAAMLVILITGTRLGGLPAGSAGHWLLMAGLLVMSPIHTAITMGQPVVLVVALTLLGLERAMKDRDGTGGLWLGLAVAIKPQVAGLFLAYYLLRGRWRLVSIACVCAAAMALIGVMPLWLSGYPWWSDWQSNLHSLRYGGFADFTDANPAAYKIVSLSYAVYQLVHDRTVTSLICVGVTAALLGWAVIVTRGNRRASEGERGALALMAVLSLLPVYHLFYDASLLAIVLVMAVGMRASWSGHKGRVAVMVLSMLPFLAPGAVAMAVWQQAGRLPHWLSAGWAWRVLILPHECWALGVLALVLAVGLSDAARDSTDQPQPLKG